MKLGDDIPIDERKRNNQSLRRGIMKNKALVVIDLQNDITKNYKEIIERVNQAIDWAD